MQPTEYNIRFDGDLWLVEMDGELLDGFTSLSEALDGIAAAQERALEGGAK
jgi:hypothetical protein